MKSCLLKAWNLLPRIFQDFIALIVDRLSGHVVPEPVKVETDRAARLYIAPANYAGQGYRWARAAEGNLDVFARNMVYSDMNPFGYEADYPVRWRTATHSKRWQNSQLEALSDGFTHVLVEAGFPPLGGLYRENVHKQVAVLRERGLKVGMLCHGSDIRLPSRHRQLEKWSPFFNDDWVRVDELEALTKQNREMLDSINAPTFVSTPGLLSDVPYAVLLPVVIDERTWASNSETLKRRRLRVAHLPSNPLVKGTAEIERAVGLLEDEGLIEYTQISGVAHEDIPGILSDSDIVLDQFRLGDYGVGACEAMAAGRLVISHVSEMSRSAVFRATGFELPIVEANIDNLELVLRSVVADPTSYYSIAKQGPEFVRQVHSGSFSRKVLEDHFLFDKLVNPNGKAAIK